MGAGTGLALCDRHLPLRVGSSGFLGDAARGTLAFPREVGSGPSSTARTDQLPCSSVEDRVLLENEIITFFYRLMPRWVVLGCGWRRWREGPEPREAAEDPVGLLVPSEALAGRGCRALASADRHFGACWSYAPGKALGRDPGAGKPPSPHEAEGKGHPTHLFI